MVSFDKESKMSNKKTKTPQEYGKMVKALQAKCERVQAEYRRTLGVAREVAADLWLTRSRLQAENKGLCTVIENICKLANSPF